MLWGNKICKPRKWDSIKAWSPCKFLCRDAYMLICLEPVPSQYGEVPSRRRERNRNPRTAPDSNPTKPPCSFLEAKWWEVEVATNLVLHLEKISEVFSWPDWTVSAIHSILPRVPPLLNTIPVCKPYHAKFDISCSALWSIWSKPPP